MTQNYRIYGSELSPYSVKVRSYFRYKEIPHQWIPRSTARRIVAEIMPTAGEEKQHAMAEQMQARMLKRVGFVGSNPITGPQIESRSRFETAFRS